MRDEGEAAKRMKNWRVAAAAIGAVMLGFGAWAIHVTSMPQHTIYVDAGGCRTPITVIEPDIDKPLGSAVVLHGLAANRRVMNYLGEQLAFDGGLRIYSMDLAGHGDNESAFTFRRAEDCAAAAVANLVATGAIDPNAAVYIGHSMGAGIAIRLADREPLAGTVAISPGLIVLPKRMPSNLLVFTGQFDIPQLKDAARNLQKVSGGNRTTVEDFVQQRAFLLDLVPRATHTSQLNSQQVEDDARDWIQNSIEAATGDPEGVVDWKERAGWTAEQAPATLRHTLGRVWYAALRMGALWGFIGLLLIFPLWIVCATKISGAKAENDAKGAVPSIPIVILEWLVFSFAGVLALTAGEPMKFVHLFTGGYLASLLLVVGILVAVVNWKLFRANFEWDGRGTLAAGVAALVIFLTLGAWLNWEFYDAWMNAPRWERFFEILPAAWLFSYAEEILLGPTGAGKKRAQRFWLYLLLRLLLFAACTFAVFGLQSGQVLIPLLAGGLLFFTVMTRLGSDALRSRTGSATAAAFFDAILAAWFIAAIFPLS